MAGTNSLREEVWQAGADKVTVREGGSGKRLLVLHEELGSPGWIRWNEALGRERKLLTPIHPGFGGTARIDWIANVRDLAGLYARMLREQKLAPIEVIGFSLGGWIAAEMAANDPSLFSSMVLVAPVGIRPPEGEIRDLFREPALAYLRRSVADESTSEFAALYGGGDTPEQYEAFEDARAETARLAWQPYMYNPSLPHLLEAAGNVPALIVWGRQDAIVPFSAAAVFQRALKRSKLAAFDKCGHRPEVEACDQFVKTVTDFLKQNS